MIEFNKRIKLTTPAGMISIAGIDAIRTFIFHQNLETDEWKAVNPEATFPRLPSLPEDWNWTWIVQRGTYAGTMPKRISSYYHKVHSLKCPPAFLTAVGNLARQHSLDNTAYDFEFVDHFDWQAGEFGDHGSCLWGSRETAKDIMLANGCKAVRFYDANGNGQGRAWFYTIQPDLHVVWGGYGFLADATLTIARVLALHLALTYKRISLTNNEDDGGLVWINAGRGYLIGFPDVLKLYDRYDLGWETNEDHCHDCGRALDEDDTYIGADDEMYCQRCYDESFDDCAHCGRSEFRDNTTYIDGMGAVCDTCLDRHYVRCETCEEWIVNDDSVVHQDEYYCRDCFSKLEPDEPNED